MTKTALIFGAGKTGRGFAAHLAFLGGYDIVLIDKNKQLVADLQKAGQYDIQILDNEEKSGTIKLSGVYQIDDVSWHEEFVETSLVFTSVFGNNLEELAKYLALALRRRYSENPNHLLTIITCENLTNAGHFLKKMVEKNLGEEKEKWLSENVGFSEAIIFRTCLDASANQSPLTVRAQNFFELPCDGDAIKEKLDVYGLKPLKNFKDQLRRKIYTYNCINAVITYLGAKKGYTQLYEAGNDAEILATARKAANETCLAQVAEFGFDPKEQEEWMNAAFAKFADKNVPDPIERNAADPERKLSRDDRLIGPALLALKHDIYPEGLPAGIMACFEYRDPNKNFKIADMILEKGSEFVLKEICGLSMEEELFMLIKEEIIKSNMNGKSEKNIAFATLDIGTSQIKLGVYCPFLSDKIILINNLQNELIYGSSGEVRAEYGIIREKCFMLFKELGSFLKNHNVEVLYMGICGHVSSLMEWDKLKGTPPEKPFPIWLDTTSYSSLDEYNAVMGNGKSKQIIGTFLPAGTNWLFTKLLYRKKSGFSNDSIFLQVGDAVFYELSGNYKTHFSSQISMVDLKKREYAQELLDHLKLNKSCLPSIDYDPTPIPEPQKKLFDFPEESFVFPAMADLYTSLYGLRLQDKEGFMLANTSEQAGAFYLNPPNVLDNFLSISFNPGYINYGSTNTGGNIVTWFLTNVLNKKKTPEILNELTAKAAAIEPKDTPIILPYLQGERAPLWNSKLTASILELRSSHTEVHLFRAILESISFARRQCFEEIGIKDLDSIKMGGGSSKNTLWNTIRASVLNKRIAVADEKELSMAGLVYYIMEANKSELAKPAINFSITEPNQDWVTIYDEKYAKFNKYQKLLS